MNTAILSPKNGTVIAVFPDYPSASRYATLNSIRVVHTIQTDLPLTWHATKENK